MIAPLGISGTHGDGPDAILLELLPHDLALPFASGVRFFEEAQILEPRIADCLTEATQVLAAVPAVLATVTSLVRVLHILDSEDVDIDVSFSDPSLPFSAFVSVPSSRVATGPLRVAEAILHEAMHLQLTLVEEVVPLVRTTKNLHFSPWRNEYRTAQGVLHALYVFRAIQAFLANARSAHGQTIDTKAHIRQRQATIARQVQDIITFRTCTDLTQDGVDLVDRLLMG